MPLGSINNSVDLLTEPLVSFWVALGLEIPKTTSSGAQLRTHKISMDRFIDYFSNSLAG